MRRSCLLAIALLGWAVCVGCSANGNGSGGGGIVVDVSPGAFSVGITLTEKFSATVTPATTSQAVTWSVSQNGSACSPTCGTIASDGTYTAPGTVPATPQVTITATSQANSHATGTATATVVNLTVNVTPNATPATDVGVGLQQQFTARVLPDNAPQTVTWTLSGCNANDCGQPPDANGLYTAPNTVPSEKSFLVQATSTLDPSGIGSATVSVVSSRIPSGSYSFSFSGYDGSHAPISVVGSFVSDGNGGITSGVEDVLTSAGPASHNITGGSYSFSGNSNDHGSITLNASGFNRTYAMVVDASGDIQIIENDGNGLGSGVIEVATPSKFKNNASLSSSFVFGFTGADKAGKRVGYVGLLPMDGAGNIAGGLLDTNDNGTANAYTSVTGTYVIANGVGSMTIAAGGSSFTFDLFGVGGTTNATNPLTLYAISTDPIDTNPAVAGSVVYQDSTQTYNNAALSKNEVINLTGVAAGGTNVSLTLASPDGKGHVGGTFDQNNAGTITTAQSFDSCVYNATGSGRYTISLLGNAGCKASSPFVLYARGLNQGFLLDQSSAAITGTMDLQKTSFVGDSDMFGPFTAGTESAASSGATPTVSNFLLTAGNPAAFGGTQYATGNASSALTGTYVMQSDGTGTVTLTQPASADLVIYAIDPVGGAGKDTSVAHFWIMDVTKGNANSSIAFAQR